MIAVLGATGNIGKHLVTSLLKNNFSVKAVTRNTQQAKAKLLAQQGAVLCEADFAQPEKLKEAIQGCSGVFGLLPEQDPPGSEDVELDSKYTKNIVEACMGSSTVSHIIFVTSVGATEGKGPYFESKKQQELIVSQQKQIPYTILRPTFIMENFKHKSLLDNVMSKGVLEETFDPEFQYDLVCCKDIAEIATAVFKNPKPYQGKVIEIASDRSSMKQIAQYLEKALKKPVVYEQKQIERFEFDFDLLKANNEDRKLCASLVQLTPVEQWIDENMSK